MDPIEAFQRFLDSFTEGGEYKYRKKLAQLSINNSRSLVVDFRDVFSFDSKWAECLINDPISYLSYADEATIRQLRIVDPEYAEKVGKIRVRFKNLLESTPLREIGANNLYKLVMIEGITTKSTFPKPILVKGAFECQVCGNITYLEQDGYYIRVPSQCSADDCGKKGPFKLLGKLSTYENSQYIQVQEKSENLPPGQLPRSITVKLVGDDLVDAARPGDRVSVIGVVKPVQGVDMIILKGRAKPTVSDVYIDGNFVHSIEREADVSLSPEDEAKILEMSKDPFIHEKIIQSIAPSIYGLETVKEAISYMLFGGVRKILPDGTTIRGDIHVLLVGDPGTAKSQLLQYVAQLSPRGVYTTGKGTTAAGLTAAFVKEKDGGLALEAGALVLADQGICCIDEIDKMSPGDRTRIHEAMEQQTISIAKAGVVSTLNARTAILAAGNPVFGRYDTLKSLAENIALPPTILERFDLIFVLTDEPRRDVDKEIAEHVLRLHEATDTAVKAPLDPNFLKKYICYAKRIKPKLTSEAKERLKEFYLKTRAMSERMSSSVSITIRQLQSLVRIAEARARMALRDHVTAEDAEHAIEIMKKSLAQTIETAEGWDIDILMTGMPRTVREKLKAVLDLIHELESKEGEADEGKLYEELEKRHRIEKSEASKLIDQLRRDQVIYIPRAGKIKTV